MKQNLLATISSLIKAYAKKVWALVESQPFITLHPARAKVVVRSESRYAGRHGADQYRHGDHDSFRP